MENRKSVRKRIFCRENLPFLILFGLMLLVHLFMYLNHSDDPVSVARAREWPFWESLRRGYVNGKALFCRYWYSVFCRFLILFAGGRFWRPALSMAYVCFAWGLSHTFADGQSISGSGENSQITSDSGEGSLVTGGSGEDRKGKRRRHMDRALLWNNIRACCVTMLIPFAYLSETGWLTTSIVYMVPAGFAMLGAVGIRRAYCGEKHNPFHWILFGVFLYLGGGHEQLSPLLAGLVFVLLIGRLAGRIRHKTAGPGRSIPFYYYMIIAFVQFVRAAIWPGNAGRVSRETAAFFPNLPSLNLIDKLDRAFDMTMQFLLLVSVAGLTALVCIMCYAIWKKYSSAFERVLGLVPVLIVFGFRTGESMFPGQFERLNLDFSRGINYQNFTVPAVYCATFLSVLLLLGICINLYLIFGNDFRTLFYTAVLFGGICSRLIMGFSPSLYVSGNRTAIVMSLCIIILVYKMLEQTELILAEKPRAERAIVHVRTAAAAVAVCGWLNFLLFV